MARVYILYQPLRVLLAVSAGFLLAAAALFVRAVYFYFLVGEAGQSGHVQSLVMAAAMAVIGVLVAILGILSDLTAMNRRLMEEVLTNTRLMRFGEGEADAHPAPGASRPAALPTIGPRREAAREPEAAAGRSGRA